VKITVDEYDNFEPVKNPAEDNVSSKVGEKVTNRPVQDLQHDISDLGGVSAVSGFYNRMGGASSAFGFISAAGGSQALQSISGICSNGLSSFSNFITGSGGNIGISRLFNYTDNNGNKIQLSPSAFEAALNGSTSIDAKRAREQIERTYGSMQNFRDQVSQIGGIDGFKSIIDKFGGADKLASALEGIKGSDGLASLAEMESKLGGPQSLKDWNDGFKNGADSVDDMIDGKTAEDKAKEQQEGKKEKEDEIITKSTTYVSGSGHPLIDGALRENVKTRLKIEVIAPQKENNVGNDIAIDLHVVGDVNMKLDGNLYKEINGKVYETYNDDHFVFHKKGYSEIQKGDRHEQIDGSKISIFGGLVHQTFKSGLEKIINAKFITTLSGAFYQIISDLIEFKALKKMLIQSDGDLKVEGIRDMDISSGRNVEISSKMSGITITSKHTTIHGSVDAKLTGDSVIVDGESDIQITADNSIDIYTDNLENQGSISVMTDNLSHSATTQYVFNSAALSVINKFGVVNETTTATVTKITTGNITETVTGAETKEVTGAITTVIGGAETKTVAGISTETIAGIKTITAPAAAIAAPAVTMAGLVYTSASSPAATADTPGGAPTVIVPVVTPASGA
jgi:hypothetical protein